MKKTVVYPFNITAFCSAFDFRWEKSFFFSGEQHNFWEIVCVIDGSVEITEDEKVYVLSSGDMICHAPTEFHRIKSYGGTEPHVNVLSFTHRGELPKNLSDGPFSLSAEELSEYTRLFKSIHRWFNLDEVDDPSVSAECTLSLSSFLLRLSRRKPSEKTAPLGRRAGEYRRIVKIMQSGIYENLTLSDIALRAAVSVSTVKSLFLSFLGISPIRYYSLLQIEEAKRLLCDGLSVSEIAERMNFSSPNYFCSFFKRLVGASPSRYKGNL